MVRMTTDSTGLNSIDHIVVLMLENRSFDHMLGHLYQDTGNVSPAGQAFEGLTGTESNPDATGAPVPVFPITPGTANAYFMPGADPGEGYLATNNQLFGTNDAPQPITAPPMTGFVTDYAYTLGWEQAEGWSIVSGTVANDIMGCYTPQALPVLSGLAKGFAVCDHWFGSVPTETLPNRAFTLAGTSQGHLDDKTKTFTSPSIFGALTKADLSWAVYGYDAQPLTRQTFTDITHAPESNFGLFADFQDAAANGSLAGFTFLEPSWGATGNSQHPNYDVALGEQLIFDVYTALRTGPAWENTLLIVTYDEHGGCYDHVPPPNNATPPDHTSILKTVQTRWGLDPLTARDAAAVDVGAVLTLATARTDDPLDGVIVPVSGAVTPSAGKPSHLQLVQTELLTSQLRQGSVVSVPAPRTVSRSESVPAT